MAAVIVVLAKLCFITKKKTLLKQIEIFNHCHSFLLQGDKGDQGIAGIPGNNGSPVRLMKGE